MLVLAAALLFEPAVVDRGSHRCGRPLVQTFPFRNASDRPIRVTHVATSCGCLAPTLAVRTYAPGERGELAVDVHTLSQAAGPQSWTVRVQYDDGTPHEATATLRATLVREIMVEPAMLAIAGACDRPHVVTVADRRATPLTVQGVGTLSPNLTATLLPATTAGERRVEVRVAATCPAGEHRDALVIRTADPAYPELRVPVTIRKEAGRVRAVPNRVRFVADGGPPAAVLLRLTDRDGQPVRVARVEAAAPLESRWSPGPGSQATVRFAVSGPGPLPPTVRVHVSEPEPQVIDVPVTLAATE